MPNCLSQRMADLHDEIDAAARRTGRRADDVRVVLVTKSAPPQIFAAARAAGITDVGENRAQDALQRMAGHQADFRWHFVGRLQANKVRKLVPVFDVFHGIDDVDLARRVDRVAGELGRRPELLLQVNVSGEASKQGLCPDDLPAALEQLSGLAHARLIGLMTMAPRRSPAEALAADAWAPDPARTAFEALRALRDKSPAPDRLPHLSMGMSADYLQAVEAGATLVRIGHRLVDGLDYLQQPGPEPA